MPATDDLTDRQREHLAMMERWQEGPLHEDLVPYLDEGEEFLSLRHPLVYQVPYWLPGMANDQYAAKQAAMDAAMRKKDFSSIIWLHERPYRIDALKSLANGCHVSNTKWWSLVGDVWTDSENIHQNLEDWEAIWSTSRPNRQAAMDKEEKAALRALPDQLTVFRGAMDPLNGEGMSWTLDAAKALWFAKRFKREGKPVVITARMLKSDVLAYFMGRNESEIVVPLRVVRSQRRFHVIAVESC